MSLDVVSKMLKACRGDNADRDAAMLKGQSLFDFARAQQQGMESRGNQRHIVLALIAHKHS